MRALDLHQLREACRSSFAFLSNNRVFAVFVQLLLHLLPLGLIYAHLYASWFVWIGHEVWGPAWPVPRTQLVMIALAIPMLTTGTTFMVAIWPGLVRLWRRVWAWGSQFRVVQKVIGAYGSDPTSRTEYELAPTDEFDESDDEHAEDEELRLLRSNANATSSWRDQAAAHEEGYITSAWTARILFYACISILGFVLIWTYNIGEETTRWKSIVKEAEMRPRAEGYGTRERIFIAANFYNNGNVIPRWTDQLARAIRYWGTNNVFVSVHESYSSDDTPDLMRELHKRLVAMNVEHRIIVKDTTIERPPSMDTRMPRIAFLSATRNRAIEPLVNPKLRRDRIQAMRGNKTERASDFHSLMQIREAAEEMWYLHPPSKDEKTDDARGGDHFDRVLFSNDIFVEAEALVELLETRDGDWDMVCGLDFQQWGLYDAWVIRDSLGRIPSSLHPFFASDAGMAAALARKPVPVQACWNGVAAFRADPLLPVELRRKKSSASSPDGKNASFWHLSSEPLRDMPKSHPRHPANAHLNATASSAQSNSTSGSLQANATQLSSPALAPPLAFRVSSVSTGECFSSECFLLPYDLRMVFNMTSIWVNPRVVVAYDWRYYVWFRYVLGHWALRWWMHHAEGWDWMWNGFGTAWHSAKRSVRRRRSDSDTGLRPGLSFGQWGTPSTKSTTITRRGNNEVVGWGGRAVTGRERAMWDARMIVGDHDKVYTWDGGECQPFQA